MLFDFENKITDSGLVIKIDTYTVRCQSASLKQNMNINNLLMSGYEYTSAHAVAFSDTNYKADSLLTCKGGLYLLKY